MFFFTGDRKETISWASIIGWSLMSSHFFYATGHQATIPTLQWNAAYTGFHGDHQNYVIPAILMVLNTFAGPILCCFGLPLLLFWPYVHGRSIFYWDTDNSNKEQTLEIGRGEFTLHEEPQKLCQGLARLTLSYLFIQGCKVSR